MKTEELNDFIKHYIEMDKTQSALMLTAPWGTGKSYYINNNHYCIFLFRQCLNIENKYSRKKTYTTGSGMFLNLPTYFLQMPILTRHCFFF